MSETKNNNRGKDLPASDRLHEDKAASQAAIAGNHWSQPTRYIMGIFLFLAVLFIIYAGRSSLSLVICAALLALLVDPVIRFFSVRLRLNRSFVILITYLFVVAAMLIIPLLLIQPLVDAINFAMKIDPNVIVEKLIFAIQSISVSLQDHRFLASAFNPALETITKALNAATSGAAVPAPAVHMSVADLSSRVGKALGALAGYLGPTFSGLASVLFTLLMSLQMTLSAGEMKKWFSDLIPPGHGPELSLLFGSIHRTWTGFLRGQIHLMVLVGLITWIGGFILGLPQAFFLGVIAGFMELIPNVGPILAAVPAVLVALLFGSTHLEVGHLVFAVIIIVFYTLVQMVENQLLVPRIMGGAVDLPPLIVLVGVIVATGSFGILGALLATPVIATGKLIFRYIYGKIMEEAFAGTS